MTVPNVIAEALVDQPRHYDIDQIQALIPHRGCMLMLRSLTVHATDRFTGEACWSDTDPFVSGHKSAVVPGSLLIEAAAQAAGAGMLASDDRRAQPRRLGMLAAVRRCQFDQQAQIGRPVRMDVSCRRMSDTLAHATVEVRQDGERLAGLQLLLALPEDQQAN
ncbi:MAG: AfsA-related hotdog domain-containing protein [Burkholderiaceae bacterium]